MTEIILVMNGHVTKSYRKLMYGQINDTKHTKMFISRSFGNSFDFRLVSDLWFFCSRGASQYAKMFFFTQRLKEKFFTTILMGWSGYRKQDYFFLGHRIALPCCGYSLESHCRCVFNEYPQRVLWRNKQNYPLIITKYPLYLFHFLCAQRRLESAWASTQSDQSLCCPLIEQLRSQGFFMRTAKTDEKGRIPSLIWVFTGRIGHFVGFVMLQLFLIFWNSLTVFEKETRFLPMTDPSLFDRVG